MAKKAPTSVSKVVAEKPSNLFRRLSAVLLINTSEFAKATPSTQTKTIGMADGLPVEFVADFFELGNKRVIRDKLLSGKNVSRELEFNGVTLDAEELKAFELIKPVLAKVEAIGPAYPWLAPKVCTNVVFPTGTGKTIIRNGYTIGKAMALLIWNKASKFWASETAAPGTHNIKANGSYYADHKIRYERDNVHVGCQTIPRVEVEYIARTMGWEPNIA